MIEVTTVADDEVVLFDGPEMSRFEHLAPDTEHDCNGVPVRTLPLDATRVIIAAGVKEGQRIVIRGADLLNQIR